MTVSVPVGACRCPGTPHEQDEVLLAPKLTIPMGTAAMAVINTTVGKIPNMQAAMTEIFFGPPPAGAIVGWSFVNEKLEPEEITSENIERLIPWTEGGAEVAREIDDLYSGDIFRPLAQRRSKASPRMSTAVSTSAERSETPEPSSIQSKPRKSSRSSSPNGTAGMRSVVRVR